MPDFLPTPDYAQLLDQQDPLASMRHNYLFPNTPQGAPYVYLCGNSLGLQPRTTRQYLLQELDDWSAFGVEGHFEAQHPWYNYHEMFRQPLAAIVGALPHEVAAMNTLTTNLHLMMVSFYRPTPQRYKILIENGPFPSDRYAVQSQVRFHGYDPAQAIIELQPRPGEDCLRAEDIEAALERDGSGIALVLMGGVNYYTGQAFDMQAVTSLAHKHGCMAGFDLAHAAGNIPLNLHDWDVDFAVWCSYKYLNSGPGGVGGCFVHERHGCDATLPRFAGWWGNDPDTRFTMPETFVPVPNVDAWQLSNAQVLPLAAHKAALDLYTQAGMPALRAKSELLTAYLEYLLDTQIGSLATIITPRDPRQRGCQISIRIGHDALTVNQALRSHGVIADYRAPDVVRVAPVPMYNSFSDVWEFVQKLKIINLNEPRL